MTKANNVKLATENAKRLKSIYCGLIKIDHLLLQKTRKFKRKAPCCMAHAGWGLRTAVCKPPAALERLR